MVYKILKPFTKGLFTDLIETWENITNYEGRYQISNFGNVKSINRRGASPDILRKTKLSKSGYPMLNLCIEGKKSWFTVHRLVAEHFIVNPENKPTVNHKDGVKTNNCVSNLEWATCKEQMAHAVVNELLEVRGAPRYSPEMKRQLKDEYSSTNTSISALSQKYAVSERTIGRIISGEIEPKTKLSRSDVVLIIELRRDGNTLKSISEKFSCGISQIHRITRGESRNVQYERESL